MTSTIQTKTQDTTKANGNGTPKKADPLNFSPHSVDAEEAVLGSILMNPEALHEVRAIPLISRDFFIERNGWIYEALCRLYDRDGAMDTRTVAEELRIQPFSGSNKLEGVGGIAYLNYLPESISTALHAEIYGRLVKRAAVRRELLGAAGEIAKLAHDETKDLYEVLDAAQSVIFSIQRLDRGDIISFESALNETYDLLESMRNGISSSIVVDTPWPDLNRIIRGFKGGQLIVPAARPGVGKSAMMTQVAVHAAKAGKHVMFSTLEMSERELLERIIAQELRIGTGEQENMSDAQWKQFVDWVGGNALDLRQITFDTSNAVTPMQLISKARDRRRRGALDILFVDYLQLMESDRHRDNRAVELGDITRKLKVEASLLDIPIFAASQLNRNPAKAHVAPTLADLKSSGAIEENAYMVIFIHNRDEADEEGANGTREFIVAKNRNGATSESMGNVPVVFLGKEMAFRSKAKDWQRHV